ncbi:GNAT family N-acetyltransferase [uncultured Marinobacter sp.]|uniref:GNAT family N-acetyltransferase n=1 Tax=uncultured Marinobacter sp. TaxID=187379 RepID=UPI00258D985B|nr:GNAT family N-acetyltransferase [uncultured Marinobacter sp.]
MTLRTEEIGKKHNRRTFDCGKPALNEFLKKIARQSSQKMATRTYVLIEDEVDPTEILGYYTLLPSTIAFPQGHPLQKRFPSDPPVYRLARLAVDSSVKGYGLGAFLVIECLKRVVDASFSVGGIGCAVDAKDDDSQKFYGKFGFVAVDAVESDSLALWLPFEQCLEAIELSQTRER